MEGISTCPRIVCANRLMEEASHYSFVTRCLGFVIESGPTWEAYWMGLWYVIAPVNVLLLSTKAQFSSIAPSNSLASIRSLIADDRLVPLTVMLVASVLWQWYFGT
jgi:hypothetical protein